MPNSLSIDLASTVYRTHSTNPKWNGSNTDQNGYSDNQMIGINKFYYKDKFGKNIGFTVTLESTTNPEWCFIYEGTDTR